MALHIRRVKLVGGPMDGLFSMASAQTAISHQEIYVYNGGPDQDTFEHAKTLIDRIPEPERTTELEEVKRWLLREPTNLPQGIPPWRVNAWLQLIHYGVVDCGSIKGE